MFYWHKNVFALWMFPYTQKKLFANQNKEQRKKAKDKCIPLFKTLHRSKMINQFIANIADN